MAVRQSLPTLTLLFLLALSGCQSVWHDVDSSPRPRRVYVDGVKPSPELLHQLKTGTINAHQANPTATRANASQPGVPQPQLSQAPFSPTGAMQSLPPQGPPSAHPAGQQLATGHRQAPAPHSPKSQTHRIPGDVLNSQLGGISSGQDGRPVAFLRLADSSAKQVLLRSGDTIIAGSQSHSTEYRVASISGGSITLRNLSQNKDIVIR